MPTASFALAKDANNNLQPTIFVTICMCICICIHVCMYMFVYIFMYIIGRSGGVPPACTPQCDPILSFSHTFSPKVPASGVGTPNGSVPPNGKSWIRHCICMYMYVYVYMYVYIFVTICMCICICVGISVYIFACVSIYNLKQWWIQDFPWGGHAPIRGGMDL